MTIKQDCEYVTLYCKLPILRDEQLETLVHEILAELARRKPPEVAKPFGKREVVDRREEGGITYQLERVQCGKKTCKRCPHGPYWYSYQRQGGKVKSRYVGKGIPAFLCNSTPPQQLELLHKKDPDLKTPQSGSLR